MRDAGAPPDSREWGALLQALALKSDWVGVEAALEECTILRGEVSVLYSIEYLGINFMSRGKNVAARQYTLAYLKLTP